MNFQIAKENQKKFLLQKIHVIMPAKLLVKLDHPKHQKLKSIMLMNMGMDLDLTKYIMNCHLMIIGLIKTLYLNN